MTQIIKAMPTLPLCLNIVAGVEKTLRDVSLVGRENASDNTPCPYDLVHDQRYSAKYADTSCLQYIRFLYMERILSLDISGWLCCLLHGTCYLN